MSIVSDYFNYLEKYKEIYGEQCAVLYMVGSFYELYGVDNLKEKTGNVTEITKLLNIQLTRKNKSIKDINRKNPLMAGIPCCSLEKYLPVLINNNYTVIVVDQKKDPVDQKISREVKNIYSTGTNIDNICDSNYITCVYIEYISKTKSYLTGITSIDLSIGDSNIYEAFGEKTHVFDKLAFFLKAFKSSEIIINTKNCDSLTSDNILNLLEIDNILVHFNFGKEHIKNISNNKYQNEYLSKVFDNDTMLSVLEFLDIENMQYAVISLISLIDFIYLHNETTLLNLKIPVIYNPGDFLSVLNSGHNQLDIFSSTTNSANSKQKCVFDIINRTKTVLGKRKLKNDIMFPNLSISKIQKRYDKIDSISKLKTTDITEITAQLKTILDMQKLHQKISLGILNPFEWCNIINANRSLLKISSITKEYVDVGIPELEINKFLEKYNLIFDEDSINKYSIDTWSNKKTYIKKGINEELDIISEETAKTRTYLEKLSYEYSNIIGINDSVKLIYIEKDGYYLSTTNIRSEILKKSLKDLNYLSNKSGTKITSKNINVYSNKLVKQEEKLKNITKDTYIHILKETHAEYFTLFKKVEECIAEIDVIISNWTVAKENNYTRPFLVKDNISKVSIKGLRHPLVEKINSEVEYITNDIDLSPDSIILYGCNSSGKSSLLKSVGIAIVLAQAGLFIACKEMVLSPFNTIVPRINGSDSILKSQSSFVVEILELKMILKNANCNTLILADELCNSTEQISASSIVASTVLHLNKNFCPFILVSHISWLAKYPPIQKIENIKVKHISVLIDNDNNILFDRKLQDGPGLDIYGLEIAKSLQLDKDFIDMAYLIRNELTSKPKKLLSSKKSSYNKDKIVDKCEICDYKPITKKDIPLDVHHINFQCSANFEGIIQTEKIDFHKNSLFNLITLCKECHKEVHKYNIKINGYISTSNGKKLDYFLR
jgi:DNA mismatch repair protein MutS